MTRLAVALCVLLLAASISAAQPPIELAGKIDSVTVYRGQALVSRIVDVPGPAGLREVVVTDLPENILPASLYAEAPVGVEVRSVRYRVRPLADDTREEVRKLDEQIQQVQDLIHSIERRRQVIADYNQYLGKLEGFVAPTATIEITKGVLNAETLKALSLFLLEQRKSLAEQEVATSIELRDSQARHELLERERGVLASSTARTAREAVLFVSVAKPEGAPLTLRYLVNGADWSPSYNVRAEGSRNELRLEYTAAIQQLSGEDWNDVQMTLSTATPLLVAKSPALNALRVALSARGEEGVPQQAPRASKQELAQQQREVEQARNIYNIGKAQAADRQTASGGRGGGGEILYLDNRELDQRLNELAGESQLLDMLARGRLIKGGEDRSTVATEGLSVTYQLPSRTSLPSRSDQQLVQIAALPLKGDFYKVATPVLTAYVYDEALLTNDSSLVLLAGPASTYVNGQFVGHAEIPTVISGEKFHVGLGIDTSLRATRELSERNETIQGGNRIVEFTYVLRIENFSDKSRQVRLTDRIPTGRDSEVKITLASGEGELSKDESYGKAERRKGILRWDVEVPAQATGASAKSVEYKLKVEHDKGMTLTGLAGG